MFEFKFRISFNIYLFFYKNAKPDETPPSIAQLFIRLQNHIILINLHFHRYLFLSCRCVRFYSVDSGSSYLLLPPFPAPESANKCNKLPRAAIRRAFALYSVLCGCHHPTPPPPAPANSAITRCLIRR